MRKILILMSVFAFSSAATAPVLACSSNQHQDSVLKAINDGNSKYNGWDLLLGISKPVGVPINGKKPISKQTIIKTALQDNLAQPLAKLILDKAKVTMSNPWFKDTLAVGTKCYSFTIDNGTLDEKTGSRTWDVATETAKINIDITYQFGSVNNDKTFKVDQYIKKTFNIKCDYTQSDYAVYSIVKAVTDLSNQTVPVTVDDKTIPTVGSVYTDFSQDTKTLVQEAINTVITNPYLNSATIVIKGIDSEKVTTNVDKLELKVNFIVSFQDSLIDMSAPSPYDGTNYIPTTLQFSKS